GQAPPPDERFYIVMERLEGVTLRWIINSTRDQGGLDTVVAVLYGLQVAEAVSIAHAKGVVHGDIKPESIFVGPRGHVWLMDFGLATKETSSGRYTSPEQVLGVAPDARADLYAICVVLYEMVAGRHPYAVAGGDEANIMAAHAVATARPLPEI